MRARYNATLLPTGSALQTLGGAYALTPKTESADGEPPNDSLTASYNSVVGGSVTSLPPVPGASGEPSKKGRGRMRRASKSTSAVGGGL